MSGSGKDVSGVVGISWDEVGAGTFPDIPLVTATGVVLVTSRSACEDVGVRRKRMWEGIGISRQSHGS